MRSCLAILNSWKDGTMFLNSLAPAPYREFTRQQVLPSASPIPGGDAAIKKGVLQDCASDYVATMSQALQHELMKYRML